MNDSPSRPPLWIKLILSILAIQLLGGLGAIVTVNQIPGWYANLERPPGTPPNAVFGPVWTVLYTLLGIAFALVWHQPAPANRPALGWFGAQLALNLAWTPVFFGLHALLPALLIIVALLIAIGFTLAAFRRIDRIAAALLLPYLLWVGYATYLNAGFWVLNR